MTLNGMEISADPDMSILQLAEKQGIEIPHFCYHPYLPIDGCCRMCLVEVERMPKLVISCNTRVMEGMIIKTNSEKVKKARRMVMEMILANHPLDCPICDQAGECTLQAYTFKYGHFRSRFPEIKRSGRKRFRIGSRLVFDEERCILCRRCIRFCRDITHTHELGLFFRGDKTTIDTYPNRPVENSYSVNTADICPVGALTSADYRFKVRTWFLTETPSICPGCANNCNIKICHRNGKIYRLLPRENPKINQKWMCDAGRDIYKIVDDENRLKSPMIYSDGNLKEVPWETAFSVIKEKSRSISGKEIGGVASAQATNEETYLFKKLMKDVFSSEQLITVIPAWQSDALLVKSDRAANAGGVKQFGLKYYKDFLDAGFVEDIERGHLKALYIVGDDIIHNPATSGRILGLLDRLDLLILQQTHVNELCDRADVVFPAAVFAEKAGTFTNIDGITQAFGPAVPLPGIARWDIDILAGIAGLTGKPFKDLKPDQVMEEMAAEIQFFKEYNDACQQT